MVNSMRDAPAVQCVLRVLSGPLQGCEFTLTRRRTLFVVGPEATFCSIEQPLTVPDDAIYIPLESDGCNFEILLEDNGRSGCVVRVLGEEDAVERALPFQSLECVGGVQVAVRPLDEDWRDELLLRSLPAPVVSDDVPRSRGSWLRLAAAGGGVVMLVAVVMVAWYASRPNPVSSVETLIAGGNSDMTVVYGRDRAVYVFADTERDANWGRQVLMRNGYAATQVLTTYDERGRLESVLANLAPQLAYRHLDLSDPAVPRLLISQQRSLLPAELQRRLEAGLSAAAPYIREVQVVRLDDEKFSRLAEEGLRRLALPFTRSKHADSVTFTVEGNLQDAELQALNRYVAEFNQQWGGRYVHFAIELKDDWLKGKSFQYGPQGYIKMTPSSWYFPKPL